MMKRKHIRIFLAAGLIILMAGGLFLWFRKSEPIRIGVILPLTGVGVTGGHSALTGIQLAVDEVNARGGVNGRPLEIVVEDGKLDADAETEAFASIEKRAQPLFYVVLKDFLTEGSPALKGDTGVVVINLLIVDELSSGDTWNLNYGLSLEDEVKPVIELMRELDVEKLGILYQEDDFSLEHANKMRKAVEDNGKTAFVESVAYEQTTYRDQIKALKDTDALYFIGFDQYIPVLLRQMGEQGYEGKFITVSSVAEPVPPDFPPEEEVYVGAPALYNPRFVFGKEVIGRYEEKYGKQIGMAAGFGYDAIRLMSELLEGKSLNRNQVRDVLDQGFSYSGVFGVVHLTPGTHQVSFPLFPARATGGELEYLR